MEFNIDFRDVLGWLFNEEGKAYFIGEKFDSNVALGLHKDGYITYFVVVFFFMIR